LSVQNRELEKSRHEISEQMRKVTEELTSKFKFTIDQLTQ